MLMLYVKDKSVGGVGSLKHIEEIILVTSKKENYLSVMIKI